MFANETAISLLLLEIVCLEGTFICGIAFTVAKDFYMFGLFSTSGNVAFFVVCFLNESIKELYCKLNEAIYDIPWYQLHPKDRRILLLALNCDQLNVNLTCAGFHEATLEMFLKVVKAACGNVMVIATLLNEHS